MKFAVIIGVFQMTFGKIYLYFSHLTQNDEYLPFQEPT